MKFVADTADRALLDDWQRDFPLTCRPFRRVAEAVGLDEDEVLSRLAGMVETGRVTRVGATCALFDADTVTRSRDNLVEYQVIGQLEAFRKLVEAAVAAALPAGLTLSEVKIEYETVEFFPNLLVSEEFVLTEELYHGSDVSA